MAMESFVASRQTYWYWPEDESKDESKAPIRIKLGTYFGEADNREQFKNIAQLQRSEAYPFDPERPLIVVICGKEVDFTGKTDLEIYMELQDKFGMTQLLW